MAESQVKIPKIIPISAVLIISIHVETKNAYELMHDVMVIKTVQMEVMKLDADTEHNLNGEPARLTARGIARLCGKVGNTFESKQYENHV